MVADDHATALCLSMVKKCYQRRKRCGYQRLKGVVMSTVDKAADDHDHDDQRFWKMMINVKIPAEAMRRFRDAYVEMMLYFARHVSQLNSSTHFYLLERIDLDSSHRDYFSELNEKV